MKKIKKQNILVSVFFALIIIALGLYIGFGNNAKDSVSTNNKTDSAVKTDAAEFKGKIVYVIKNSDSTDIYTVDKTNTGTKVFTDKDEDLKIKAVSSVTRDGKALALMSPSNQEFGGSLYLINCDGTGNKEKIVDQFASTETPIISPDGKKIAYLIFSNLETEYGYTLIVMDKNGSNKQKITNDEIGLKIYSWSSDSRELIFTKGDNSKDYTLYKNDLLGGKDTKITSFKEKIYSLSWVNDKIILSKGPLEKESINKSELYVMDSKGNGLKKLTTNDTHEDYVFISQSTDKIAYILNTFENTVDINKTSSINIMDMTSENNKKLLDANYIIGFIE